MPVVLIVSIAMIAIGLSLIQATSSIRLSLTSLYTDQIATEAASSGVVYANYCYGKSGIQTWSQASGKPLTPQTDCTGTQQAGFPQYLISTNQYKTTFSVGDIEAPGSATSVIDAAGTVSTYAGSGGSPSLVGTTTYNQKQVLNSLFLRASQSSSGKWKTCGIVTNKLYCWGWNQDTASPYEPYNGNIGDGTTTTRTTPVAVDTSNFQANEIPVQVVAAQYHSCVRTQIGNVYCWGSDAWGQLGDGQTTGYSAVPIRVTGLGPAAGMVVTDVAVAGNTTCAIANAKTYCWGGNLEGSAGINNTDNQHLKITAPTAVSTAKGLSSTYSATKLATSGFLIYDMCMIADGKPYCWGSNENGQIGNGASGGTNVLAPTPVVTTGYLSGKTITDITRGGAWYGDPAYGFTCALASGSVYCWGTNYYGELGNGGATGTKSTLPYPVSPSADGKFTNTNVDQIYAGLNVMCALSGGAVYCWGSNQAGQLGTGTSISSSSVPIAVYTGGALSGLTVTSLAGGGDRGCAIANYTNYCWGNNNHYQLGDGTNINKNVPTTSYFLQPTGNQYLF